MYKFEIRNILTQIGLRNDELDYFEGAILERPVFVTTKNALKIKISVQAALPFSIYSKVIHGFGKISKSQVNMQIRANQCLLTIKDIESYVRYYSMTYSQQPTLQDVLLRVDDEKVEILCSNENHAQQVLPQLQGLSDYLESCGIYRPCLVALAETQKDLPEIVFVPNGQPKEEPRKTYRKKRLKERYLKIMISDIVEPTSDIQIEGEIFSIDNRMIINGEQMVQVIQAFDETDAISIKRFSRQDQEQAEFKKLKVGDRICVSGQANYDKFTREISILADDISLVKSIKRKTDDAPVKRVEWHTHSKMSEMDGITDIEELVEQAFFFGHPAVAITDHLGVQAFPKAQAMVARLKKKHPDKAFKMIYGVEMNLVDPQLNIVRQSQGQIIDEMTMVVFDVETTGLSAQYDHIIEFGAVKIVKGEIVDRMQTFVKPPIEIPAFITEKTNISNEHVNQALPIQEVLLRILEFFKDAVLVAHNASFDIRFINENCRRMNLPLLSNTVIDTLDMARALIKDRKTFRLGRVARYYLIPYDEDVAHRADYDAEVTAQVVLNLLREAKANGCINVDQIQALQAPDSFKNVMKYHVQVIARDAIGLKNLYQLVTISHTDYLAFFGKANSKKEEEEFIAEPRIPRFMIQKNRDHLLIGSSCFNGEIFEIAAFQTQIELEKAMQFYDYIEIQPPSNYQPLLDNQVIGSLNRLLEVIQRIIKTAKKLSIPVLVTGDVHYLTKAHKRFRDIYIQAQGIGGVRHPLYVYNTLRRYKTVAPDQHFKTTQEMLDDFSFLDSDLAYELVVENPNRLLKKIDDVYPIKDTLFTPKIDGADEKLSEICMQNAIFRYGNPLPKIVKQRLDKELNAILANGFGVIYYISHLLVKKSLDDGYLVGSRGSVGSSLVATMANITEVNPLPPHYVCPQCYYHQFFTKGEYGSGFDLLEKSCPTCNTVMISDGQDIPFETFLGFDGDKIPDIDLNFSGEYQDKAHAYTKVLFGEDSVYRAGTIGTVAEKTAFGYISGYFEEMGLEQNLRQAQRNYLALGSAGVKRTSGQHPGGIIVIPQSMDVHDFTPIQFPANNPSSDWKTTHFDFNDLHENLLKLDILGHVDPTAMKMLERLTGVDPSTIPMNDAKTMAIFCNHSTLNIDSREYSESTGAAGIPEFGTTFVRDILKITQPQRFSDLVRISGLSHGTDVWMNNARDLIKAGNQLSQVIGCRDDIMVYLIQKGLKSKQAFDIMESVRRGKGLKPEWIVSMKEHNIEDWYIDSCQKIKYMFPKAHAVAYVIMAVRVAWFKVYYPQAYYATFFTLRCNAYDIETMVKGAQAIRNKLQDIEARLKDLNTKFQVTKREKELVTTLEVALEMILRGYRFSKIDLRRSWAEEFSVHPEDNRILIPPFSVLDGLGASAAKTVIEARENHYFLSKEDLQNRTQLNTTVIRRMEVMGVLDDLQDENQLSLF